MIRSLLIVPFLLLLTIGCGGGSKQTHYISLESLIPAPEIAPTPPDNSRTNDWQPRSAYSSRTGETIRVTPSGVNGGYVDYRTGRRYVPMQGRGGFYTGSEGGLIRIRP